MEFDERDRDLLIDALNSYRINTLRLAQNLYISVTHPDGSVEHPRRGERDAAVRRAAHADDLIRRLL